MAEGMKRGPVTYATYLLWSEPEFMYHEYIINCTRSKVEPSVVDDPPLSILLTTRVM